MNKKGNIQDALTIFGGLFIAFAAALVFLYFLDAINTGFASEPAGQAITQSVLDQTRDRIDNALVLFFFILIIGSWVSAFFLDNHPIFFVIFFLLSFISFFILIPFTNVALNFANDDAFITHVQYLPKVYFIINHTAQFLAFYIVTIGILLYAKNKYGIGTQQP
jgi:glycerol uptake facilitator-like aquaporin